MTTKILTTLSATDRLISTLRHLDRMGFIPEVVYALEDKEPRISFNRSMKHIMETTDDVLLLFEDDVYLKDNTHLQKAIEQLPKDWELCYLGANIMDGVERYSDNLFRMFGGWTTHAVMYRNPKEIGAAYTDTNIMFDDWLKNNYHSKGNTYIVAPMIAWQLPHKSELWNHFVDYTNIFTLSANKLI